MVNDGWTQISASPAKTRVKVAVNPTLKVRPFNTWDSVPSTRTLDGSEEVQYGLQGVPSDRTQVAERVIDVPTPPVLVEGV